MSISTTVQRPDQFRSAALLTLAAATRRICAAYITWRMERSAVAVLRSMSDRELQDVGLSRADIANAVRGKAVRDRPLASEALTRRP